MFTEKLNPYLIPGALEYINLWCEGYPVRLVIKNARTTKLGDYIKLDGKHQITLNHGLDKALSFHILTHEIAHMHAREMYGRNIKPHGPEWKSIFSNLILQTIHLFEPELQSILKEFAKNPRAGYYSYRPLAAYFQKKENAEVVHLQDLAIGTIFRIKDKIYKKGQKRKIRYLCKNLATGKQYSVHPLAPINEIIEDGKNG